MPVLDKRRALGALVALLWLVLAPACSSPSEPDRPVDVTLVLAPGETRAVSGAAARITFLGVAGDSRCPADALCVLGGDAQVEIVVATGEGSQRFDLHTGDNKPVVYGRFTIALVELSPYPFSARPIDPGDYRAKLRITG